MRVGEWIQPLNISIKRAEERPDHPKGDVVFRLIDLFTTRDGSWEPRSGHLGAVPQWARDAYLRPWDAPDRFDDAGADHHLFARVLDLNGAPITEQDSILYWSDGFHQLGNPSYNGFARMTPKQHSGWANLVMAGGSSYVPERGEHGPWCWCPRGAADVVTGAGMPANHHISFFAVWQAQRRSGQPPVDEHPVDEHPTEVLPNVDLSSLTSIRQEAWRQVGVAFNRDSSFANYARVHGLGAPLTNEYDIGNFRAQGFVGGIVYAPIGQWHLIQHVAW
ncbi:MAG: hypothetical protein R2873_25055 [Caldilineaceae bacterium]|nr:hypothetical protein [Caldilineaceae bacterium]